MSLLCSSTSCCIHPQTLLLLLLLSRFCRVRLCATHRWQPTRLPGPWDSPGKNTGEGCHFLLQCMKVKVKLLSEVARLLVTPWTAAYKAPPSMGFSRQEYWSGLPFPSPGDLPDPGIKPRSPALQADTLVSEQPGKPLPVGVACAFQAQASAHLMYFQGFSWGPAQLP